MKMRWKGLAILAAALFLGCAAPLHVWASPAVEVGDSYQTVLKKMGSPANYIKSGRNELLFYGSTIVEIMDNEVVAVDGRRPPPHRKTEARSSEATGTQTKEADIIAAGRVNTQRVIDFRQKGKAIDIRPYLVPGAFTVVAFYADWWPACRERLPSLEEMVRSEKDVYLRKIDISSWKTAVTGQYKVPSIPNFRLFGRDRRQLGESTSSVKAIAMRIEQAR